MLVARGGAIGDFILTLPVIDALRDEFGNDNVEVLANSQVLGLTPVAAVGALDDPTLAHFFVAQSELAPSWCERFRDFDIVLSYLHDPAHAFQRNMQRCGVRKFVSVPAKLTAATHATEQLQVPLRQFGMAPRSAVPQLHVSDEEIAQARRRLGVSNSQALIALHPGSGSAAKNWPIENWLALAELLLSRHRIVAVIAGEADHAQFAAFRSRFGERVLYAVEWPLREVAALLAGSHFVGHDSGISHLAAAVGANCIALFGPTDPAVWAPRGLQVQIIRAPNGDLRQLPTAAVSAAVSQELMRIGIRT